jgi:methionine synthase II (cobalamin-independent)
MEALEKYQARIDKIWEAGALTNEEFRTIDDAFVDRAIEIQRDD